jgi:hypothetical protein
MMKALRILSALAPPPVWACLVYKPRLGELLACYGRALASHQTLIARGRSGRHSPVAGHHGASGRSLCHWIGGAGDTWCPQLRDCSHVHFSIATVAPRYLLRLHELGATRNETELAWFLTRRDFPLCDASAAQRLEVSQALMDMAGLHGGPVRPPLVNVRAEEEEELRAILTQWKSFL